MISVKTKTSTTAEGAVGHRANNLFVAFTEQMFPSLSGKAWNPRYAGGLAGELQIQACLGYRVNSRVELQLKRTLS